MATVSVIVPVYNVEKELTRCIDSVVAQSFLDFELILIDDGSPDCSSQICDRRALEDERIVVIHQPNGGVSAARNNGLKISAGEYVTVIDSDDWVSADYLKRLYEACEKHQAQISVCDVALVDETQEKVISCIAADEQVFSNREAVQFYSDALFENKINQVRAPWAKLVKREIITNHSFPTDRIYAEDAACVYLWLWEAAKAVHVSFCGYYYYQNPKGICRQPIREYFLGNFLTEKEWICFFAENHFDSLHRKACRKYVLEGAYACQNAADKKSERLFRSVLRTGLRKYSRFMDFDLSTDEWILDTAYPNAMKFYWLMRSVKRKIRKKK